jgi:hypothetical protein
VYYLLLFDLSESYEILIHYVVDHCSNLKEAGERNKIQRKFLKAYLKFFSQSIESMNQQVTFNFQS